MFRSTLAVCFLLLCSSFTYAADLTPLFNNTPFHKNLNDEPFSQSITLANTLQNTELLRSLERVLELGDNTRLVLESEKAVGRYRALRFSVRYQSVPVLDMSPVILMEGEHQPVQSYGYLPTKLEDELGTLTLLTEAEQQARLNAYLSGFQAAQATARVIIRSSVTPVIFLDENQRAHYALALEIFSDILSRNNDPQSVRIILDVNTQTVLAQHDMLQHLSIGGGGPSGNARAPANDYQPEDANLSPPATFIVDRVVSDEGALCYFDAQNVETRSAEHESDVGGLMASPFVYDCTISSINNYKSINTAKSPLNDAHYRGQVSSRMFEQYLGQKPFFDNPIVQYVHYGKSFDNAFYEGGTVYFGDGGGEFYPLVSLNTIAHEIAHGFTAGHGADGGQKYMRTGEAIAINEAFSDMAGEAAEYFLTGSTDWLVGADSWPKEGAVRYMQTPTRDGKSVDHISQYNAGLDGHYGSGIFNKAFFTLATNGMEPGAPWNIQYAFYAFANANQACWLANSIFMDAADCVMRQASAVAMRLQSDGVKTSTGQYWSEAELANHIRKAFAVVGLILHLDQGVESEFSSEKKFLTVNFTNFSRAEGVALTEAQLDGGWSTEWNFGDGSASATTFNAAHTYSESGEYTVTLTITSPNGESDNFLETLSVADDYCHVGGEVDELFTIRMLGINGLLIETEPGIYSDNTQHPVLIPADQPLSYTLLLGPVTQTAETSRVVGVWLDSNSDGVFTDEERLSLVGTEWQSQKNTDFIGRAGETYRLRVVSSADGLPDSPCGEVEETAVADFSLIWNSAVANQFDWLHQLQLNQVVFSSTTNDTRIASYHWDFGDGTTSSDPEPSHSFNLSGNYEVNLTVKDAKGEPLYNQTKTVAYSTHTEPRFYHQANDHTITFSNNQSIYPENSTFLWDFGDGSTSNEEMPAHTYAELGSYIVTLTISNPDNPQGITDSSAVTVRESVSAPSFKAKVLRRHENTYSVEFGFSLGRTPKDKHSGQWEILWQFGDGEQSESQPNYTSQKILHTYNAPGEYTVNLTFRYRQRTGSGELDWVWASELSTLEVVLEAADTSAYCEAQGDTMFESVRVVEINGQRFETGNEGGLINPDNPILIKPENNHYYIEAAYEAETAAERYYLWLDANRDYWFGSETQDEASPERLLNRLDFLDYESGRGYIEGFFNAPLTDTTPGSYFSNMRLLQQYEFVFSYTLSPCHNYLSSGYDSGEVEDYRVKWVVPANADISYTLSEKTLSISNGTQAGASPAWVWDFGDGNTSAEQNPVHEYTSAGDYLVSLKVNSDAGDTLAQWQTAITLSADTSVATNPQLSVSLNDNILSFDTAASTYPADSTLLIDFGDGDTSALASGTHTYNTAGTYTVTITISNAAHPEGSSSQQSITVTLPAEPEEPEPEEPEPQEPEPQEPEPQEPEPGIERKKSGGGGSVNLFGVFLLTTLYCLRRRRKSPTV